MNVFERTPGFDRWLRALRDGNARARVVARILSAQHGNFGDCKAVGQGVSEMRIDFGPGYRVYFTRRGATVYLLLAGGDKSTQARDIERARNLARDLGDAEAH